MNRVLILLYLNSKYNFIKKDKVVSEYETKFCFYK